jgi:hypothetical protein
MKVLRRETGNLASRVQKGLSPSCRRDPTPVLLFVPTFICLFQPLIAVLGFVLFSWVKPQAS